MKVARRRLFIALLVGAVGAPSHVMAEPATAPFAVQAEIVTRILPYDRGFSEKVKSEVSFLVLSKTGDADSATAASQMRKALTDIGTIREKPVRVESAEYSSSAKLIALCRAHGINVLYISPGLANDIGPISSALVDSGILSFAAVETYVSQGIVLGVDVANGKPRMSINVAQARSQHIDFPSAILKLARIY